MLGESLATHLTSNGALAALVVDRVYPLLMKQGTAQPCVVYTIDTEARNVRQAGSDSLVRGLVQIDCYATTSRSMELVATAVRNALLGFSGTMTAPTSPITSVRVQNIFLDGESSLLDEEPGLFRKLQQFVVWYDEA